MCFFFFFFRGRGGVRFTSLEKRNWEFSQNSRESGEWWKVSVERCAEMSLCSKFSWSCGRRSVQLQGFTVEQWSMFFS